ncbi:glycoside hydrolase family 113 [Adhaeribacter rhizoryzae]|nr:glycoside hydrolase TIM-barrel-like domain-containing protein [Adhaeribacter rhizoryzae]
MIRKSSFLLIGLALLSFAFICKKYFAADAPMSNQQTAFALPNRPELMRGVSWVAADSVTLEQLQALKQNNIEWISQTPFGWQAAYNSPEVRLNTRANRAYWGESDLGLINTTRQAKKLGIKTLLKPHIWLHDRTGKWLGDIEMNSEAEWQDWFRNYRTFILHYAQLAQQEQIEAFCIGTELHKPAVTHEQAWRDLIKDIRKVYSGQLTYAANWYLEYEQIKFWDELDFIGVQAYFPLTKKNNPTLKELKKGWEQHLPDLAKIARRYQKPIVFTEAGYKSTPDAGIEPWKWPERGAQPELPQAASTQAACYEAMFQTVWHQPWFRGMYIWKWYPRLRENRQYHGDFTPQNKPAAQILAQWYGKQ